ncbi:NUDIX domain-containing protein [Streptomyces sp. M10(2022)]
MAPVAVRRPGDLPGPQAALRRLVVPQGKAEAGEPALEGALREVLEETGYHCAPGARLPTSRYLANGHPKVVTYWAAEATGAHSYPTTRSTA